MQDNTVVNLGFAAGCNAAAGRATGEILLFLNNDTEVQPGWLPPILAGFDDWQVGVVGCKLLYPDGRVQHAGVDIVEHHGGFLEATHADPALADVRRYCQAVTGACLAVRRHLFVRAGGFDPGYWCGYEDVDLCLTVGHGGRRVLYEPASVVVHHESQAGPERWRCVRENVARLQTKWAGRVEPDRRVA